MWLSRVFAVYLSVPLLEAACFNPIRQTPPKVIPETSKDVDLLTFDADADSGWTVELKNPESYSPQELRTFLNGSVGFRGQAGRSRCPGPATCTIAVLNPIDLEHVRTARGSYAVVGSSLQYTVTCTVVSTQTTLDSFLTVAVASVNEFRPRLTSAPVRVAVAEGAAVGSVVVNLSLTATDDDYGETVTSVTVDDTPWFWMADHTARQQGLVTVRAPLDYERLHADNTTTLTLPVRLTDSGGRSGTGTLVITVTDTDDNPPVFLSLGCGAARRPCHRNYTVHVSSLQTGVVTGIQPAAIRAADGDPGLANPVNYSLRAGPEPLFLPVKDYVLIQPVTGTVVILQPLADYGPPRVLVLTVTATEDSQTAKTSTALLVLNVSLGVPDGRRSLGVLAAVGIAGGAVFAAGAAMGGCALYHHTGQARRRTRTDKDTQGQGQYQVARGLPSRTGHGDRPVSGAGFQSPMESSSVVDDVSVAGTEISFRDTSQAAVSEISGIESSAVLAASGRKL